MKRSITEPIIGLAIGLILLTQPMIASGQEQTDAALAKEAESYFAAQDWVKAVAAYEKLTQREPANGRSWNRLGYALLQTGKYERAAQTLRRAVEIGAPAAVYNLACAYARLNDKEKAFEWLKRALDSGSPAAAAFQRDPDLASLRDDARYAEMALLAEKIAKPCLHKPEYRQFDFWAGEWDVKNPQGQLVGTNSIQRVVDGCLLLENWTSTQGVTGKSVNFFNAETGKWRQTWVDNQGGVLELDGEYKDGALRYTGVTADPDGRKTLERLTFFNLGPDRVRQLWEQSKDDGKTWVITFDGDYVRKKAPAGFEFLF